MKDEANISLVYAHAKSYGCYDDVYFFVHPQILYAGTLPRLKAGMVSCATDASLFEQVSQLFTVGPSVAVNDTLLAIVALDASHE